MLRGRHDKPDCSMASIRRGKRVPNATDIDNQVQTADRKLFASQSSRVGSELLELPEALTAATTIGRYRNAPKLTG